MLTQLRVQQVDYSSWKVQVLIRPESSVSLRSGSCPPARVETSRVLSSNRSLAFVAVSSALA